MGSSWSGEGGSSSKSAAPDGIIQVTDAVFKLSEPSIPVEVEIVFLHGLQVYRYEEAYWKTWVAGGRNKDGKEAVCWPMAWLGKQFPGARIWSISYDSSALRTSTTGNMDGFLLGESLVQNMVGLANIGQENRPVVFVCHSLGGLVVKEIVIKAHETFGNEPKYRNFLQNIRAFHFYATPHDGSKLADLAARLFPKMGKMVSQLRVINDNLGRLNAEFERIERVNYPDKWKFAVVAETHNTTIPSGFSVKVVQEASARHGYTKFLAVNADHFGVCKPETQISSSYLSLTGFIRDVMSEQCLTQSTVAERQLDVDNLM